MNQQRLDQLASSNSCLRPIELSFLQQDISTRKESIEKLERELEALKSECDFRQALVSPLRRSLLPPEILGEILCDTLSISDLKPAKQVGVICLVCRSWRGVALTTPRLWADVYVSLSGKSVDSERVKTWLSRSGTLPKALHIDASHAYECSESVCPLSTIAHLVAEGPVLKSLSLNCDYPRCFNDLLNSTATIATTQRDSLRSLHIGCGDEWGGAAIDFFHLLPKSLSSLSVKLPVGEYLPQNLTIPSPPSFPSLSTLKLRCEWPVAWLLDTVKACPNLEDLTLHFDNSCPDFHQGPTHGQVHAFPRIRVFRLHGPYYPYEGCTAILGFLAMPSLTELDIAFHNDSPYHELPSLDMFHIGTDLTALAQRSSSLAALHTLRLRNMGITGTGLNAIFGALPSVSHLVLDHVEIFGYPFFGNVVLPRLEVLEVLNLSEGTQDCTESVLAFVERRSRPSTPSIEGADRNTLATIRKAHLISVWSQERPTFSDERYTKILDERGVDLSLSFPSIIEWDE